MKTSIVLVHGFSGSPENLTPVGDELRRQFPGCRVLSPAIAGGWEGGHAGDSLTLDLEACREQFIDIISSCRQRAEKIVLLGHSTGGNLLLSFLAQGLVTPDLLVLTGSPWKVSGCYLERWQAHSSVDGQVSLSVIAHLISFVNRVSSSVINEYEAAFPVLLMYGEDDELVPTAAAFELQANIFTKASRVLLIPNLEHHFLADSAGTDFFLENLCTAIDDIQVCDLVEDRKLIEKIIDCETEVERFVTFSPVSIRHLVNSPSGRSVSGSKLSFPQEVVTAPVFANIEITTKCNLDCVYCARKFICPEPKNMTSGQFNRVLDLLPHAYRVTIVGLGEPLLHPGLTDFIHDIERRKQRSGIVTNAMLLDKAKSTEILQAGLKAVAFSLDAANPKTLEKLRAGSDLSLIIGNLKNFMRLAQKRDSTISSAVFSALSQTSLDELDGLAELVATLGVHVWMVSDLNFRRNVVASLSSHNDRGITEKDITSKIRRAITTAFSHGLPVLSVRALEAFGLRKKYQKFLLFSPKAVFRRSVTHRWCHSPWQTMPINVNGDVTLCDCQPDQVIGNIFRQPLSEIWNGDKMLAFREAMTSDLPPAVCLVCPRF